MIKRRHLALAACLLIWPPIGAAAEEPPFTPGVGGDHVVTMKGYPISGPPEEISRTVRRRGSKFRIDTVRNGQPAVTYYDRDTEVLITIARNPTGASRSLSARRTGGADGLLRDAFWAYEKNPTGESKRIAGQTCAVWEVSRYDPARPDRSSASRDLRCLTSDGIELWRAFDSQRNITVLYEAVALDRSEVDPADVAPPTDLFDAAVWGLPSPQEQRSGWIVRLERQVRLGEEILPAADPEIIAKFGPWSLTEEIRSFGRGRMIRLRNEESGSELSVMRSPDGKLEMMSVGRREPSGSDGAESAVLLRRGDIVLGERCEWWDLTPDLMDGGERQCKAEDGVPLAAYRFARGARLQVRASSVRRGSFAFAELPWPADALSAAAWGLPQ